MGGLGALMCGLKNKGMYRSISAFCPIANPSNSIWGQKGFNGFLGSVVAGSDYDPTLLIAKYQKGEPQTPILID